MTKGKVVEIGRDWLNEDREPSNADTVVVRKPRKMPKKVYSPQQLADIWGVDEDTITKACRKGTLKGYAVGSVWRVSEEDWFDYLEKQTKRKGVG